MATPNGPAALAWFEWGADRNYGQVTAPAALAGGSGVIFVRTPISGLVDGQVYHFRLVVSNAVGIRTGADQQLTSGSKVTSWGWNESGQATVPQNLLHVVAVSGGYQHSVALKNDGSITSWGDNSFGQTNPPPALITPASIASGNFHNLASKADGTVVAWGYNSSGQCNVPANLSNVVGVSAGWFFSAALRADGTVLAWGDNFYGQTNVPGGLINIVAISAGGNHVLALRANGTVVSWGDNSYGQTNVPSSLTNVIAVAAGGGHSLALKVDGSVVGWGSAVPSPPPGLSNVVAIAAGNSDNMALKSDGSLLAWGNNAYNNTILPPGMSPSVAITEGTFHSLALANVIPKTFSELIFGTANHDLPTTLRATDTNGEATLSLRISQLPLAGALYQYDSGNPGLRGPLITAPATAVSDAAGRVIFAPQPNAFGNPYASFSFVANDGDGDSTPATITVSINGDLQAATLRPWLLNNQATLNGMVVPNGFNTVAWFEWGTPPGYGQATAPMPMGSGGAALPIQTSLLGLTPGVNYHCRLVASNALGIVYGFEQVFGLGKKLAAWGQNGFGESAVPPGLTNVVDAASANGFTVALKSDGKVIAWGNNYYGQTNVPVAATNVVAIAAGDRHVLALRADGIVVGWPLLAPAGLSNVIAISAGWEHDLALKSDGTLFTWGSIGYNQAVVPEGLSNVVAIGSSANSDLALRANGTVVAWGDNYNGWLTPPPGLTNVVAIAAGGSHRLALRSDRSIVPWGDNSLGQTNVPAGLSNVVAITAGSGHSLALKSDGSVAAWGLNSAGQTNVPAGLVQATRAVAGVGNSLALAANTLPVAFAQTASGPVNQDLVVTLAGQDFNGDALVFRVLALPAAGTLYQYNSGSRGAAIAAGGIVSDLLGRVIFAPPANAFGKPLASFAFVAGDGQLESASADVMINIMAPTFAATAAAWVTNASGAVLRGAASAGHLPSWAWFEWGPTRGYGQTTTSVPLATGSNLVWLSNPISGLAPNSVYHSRLIVSNAGGIAYGYDRVFTTGRKPVGWGNTFSSEEKVPAGMTNLIAISEGVRHVLGLRNDGTVVAWGDNFYKQTTIPSSATNVIDVAAGGNYSVALRGNGTVVAWGGNNLGETNVPATLTNATAIAAGVAHALAVRSDGTVTAWGSGPDGQTNVPAGLSNVVAVAAGTYHSLALRGDGRVVAWGSSLYGNNQTNVPASLSNVVAIWCNCCLNIAIRADGPPVAWGGSTNLPSNWADAVDVTGILALKADSTVSASEPGIYGQGLIPVGLTNVAAIAQGYYSSMVLGNLPPVPLAQVARGPANYDLVIQLNGSDPQEDPLTYRITGLPGSGALYQYSAGSRGPLIASIGTQVTDLRGRVVFVPGTDQHGAPYTTFAFSAHDGDLASTNSAVVTVDIVGTPFAITQPAGPIRATNAVLNGTVVPNGFDTVAWFEWGTPSAFGQTTGPLSVGTGVELVRLSAMISDLSSNALYRFRLVASNSAGIRYGAEQWVTTGRRLTAWGLNDSGQTNVPPNAKGVVVPGTTAAIKNDGRLVTWGNGPQTNAPANISDAVAIADNLLLRSDGTVVAWGDNFFGQTNVPPEATNVVAIASGLQHRLALRADGRVIGWGYNADGEVSIPESLSNVVAIAAGVQHSVALKADGTVVAWGENSSNQTNVPPGLSNVVAIAANGYNNLALLANGRVTPWGFGGLGQLNVPPDATNVIAIVTGSGSLVLKKDGSLLAWGNQSAVPAGLTNIAAIAGSGTHNVALRLNRAPTASPVAATGVANRDLLVYLVADDTDFDSLRFKISSLPSAGVLYQYTASGRGAAITVPGTAVSDSLGRVFFAPALDGFGPGYSSFGFVASDGEVDSASASVTVNILAAPLGFTRPPGPVGLASASLKATAVARGLATTAWFEWGTNTSYGQVTVSILLNTGAELAQVNAQLSGLTPHALYHCRVVISNAAGITLGSDQPFVTGGKVTAWGANALRQSIVPVGTSNIVAVAAGQSNSVALRANGTVLAWGAYAAGQTNIPAGLTNVIAIAAGNFHGLALRSNGTVAAWGSNANAQTNVPPSATNVVAIAAEALHSLALKSDGTVVGWGDNSNFQLSIPFGLSNVVAIDTGLAHSIALKSDGTVITWGSGSSGVPSPLTNVVAIAAGLNHNLALRADGTLAAWGNNQYGQGAVPLGVSNVIAIAAGSYHNLALRGDGSVMGWGLNVNNQAIVPIGLVNVAGIAAGAAHSLALAPNRRPSAIPKVLSGSANHDLVVNLVGSDLDNDPLAFTVKTLPGKGILYQFVGPPDQFATGPRGAPITTTPTILTDVNRSRVIFAPAADDSGSPYATFITSVHDGELESLPVTNVISISAPIAPVTTAFGLASNGSFQLNFTGDSNTTYCAWASTNLKTWELLGNAIQVTPGKFLFVDATASGLPARFYRLATGCGPPPGQFIGYQRTANGVFEVNFTGGPYRSYSVWASTNLQDWVLAGAAEETAAGLFRFVDGTAGAWPQRFYRAVAP